MRCNEILGALTGHENVLTTWQFIHNCTGAQNQIACALHVTVLDCLPNALIQHSHNQPAQLMHPFSEPKASTVFSTASATDFSLVTSTYGSLLCVKTTCTDKCTAPPIPIWIYMRNDDGNKTFCRTVYLTENCTVAKSLRDFFALFNIAVNNGNICALIKRESIAYCKQKEMLNIEKCRTLLRTGFIRYLGMQELDSSQAKTLIFAQLHAQKIMSTKRIEKAKEKQGE